MGKAGVSLGGGGAGGVTGLSYTDGRRVAEKADGSDVGSGGGGGGGAMGGGGAEIAGTGTDSTTG